MTTLSAVLSAPGVGGPAPTDLGPLRWVDLVTEWRPDPVALALLVAVAFGYTWYRIRAGRSGVPWARHRDVIFAIGIAAAVWVTNGSAEVRATRIEWVWMAQLLTLLLVLPLVILAGQPVQLARQVSGADGLMGRITRSRPVRVVANPLIGPALVPVIFLVLLYGGVGQAAAASPPVGWLLHAAFLILGAMIALPLVDARDSRSSLAVAIALAIGFVELIMDVFPGIAMRLAGHPLIPYFAAHSPSWTSGWLYEQHQAGGLLWIALEVLDLPFLVFLAVRWVRVDAAEAAQVDALLDADAAARAHSSEVAAASTRGLPGVAGGLSGAVASSVSVPVQQQAERPWFLDDPQLRDRYRF